MDPVFIVNIFKAKDYNGNALITGQKGVIWVISVLENDRTL